MPLYCYATRMWVISLLAVFIEGFVKYTVSCKSVLTSQSAQWNLIGLLVLFC